MHVRIVIEGEAAAWDPADPRPFAAVAGTQFVRTEGDTAVVRTEGGTEMPVYPGWLAVGAGPGRARFVTPEVAAGNPQA